MVYKNKKSMKNLFLLLGLFFLPALLFAQIDDRINIWYFGTNAGLNFNTGVATALEDGELITAEGCATSCDENGNLLFYTDGQTVWDKEHNIMPNGTGLMGDWSATQSAIIVPSPGSSNIYYIFTIDAWQNNLQNGLRYSIVDLNLNGGLGDITSTKNILLHDLVCEKIAAVANYNETSVWVIAHGWNNNEFYSYKLSSTGIDPNPVVSSVGISHSSSTGYRSSIGYMNISPSRDRLAVAIRDLETVELFDINRYTGTISNPINISVNCNNGVYGVDFSNNSNVLYVSTHYCGIYQYDISSNNETIIQNSQYNIPNSSVEFGGIQLGPNGKMYVARKLVNYLGVIENSNNLGADCDYNQNGVFLGSGESHTGLPTQFYFKGYKFFTGSEQDLSICPGDSIFIKDEWQTEAGTFYDTTVNNLGWDSIINIHLTILPNAPTPIITENSGILYSNSATGNQWFLNGNEIAGATNQQYQPSVNGTYQVSVENENGCTSISNEYQFISTSVEDQMENSISIYPNPFKNNITIEYDNEFRLTLFDVSGKIMVESESTSKNTTLNLDELEKGVYILNIENNSHEVLRKIIIKQ